jgi:hypothetical protein
MVLLVPKSMVLAAAGATAGEGKCDTQKRCVAKATFSATIASPLHKIHGESIELV